MFSMYLHRTGNVDLADHSSSKQLEEDLGQYVVLDRVRHFLPIQIHRFFAVNRYRSDTDTLQEPWRSVTERSKAPDAVAATNNSGGGQRGGGRSIGLTLAICERGPLPRS